MNYKDMLKFIEEKSKKKFDSVSLEDLKEELSQIKNGDCIEYEFNNVLFLIDRNIKSNDDVTKDEYTTTVVEDWGTFEDGDTFLFED